MKLGTTPAVVLATLTLLVCVGCGQPRGESEEPRATPGPGPELEDTSASTETATAETDDDARAWSFEQIQPGEPPDGFVTAVGRWEVTEDETAPSGTHSLAQLATSPDAAFNVTLVEGTSEGDVDLSVQLRSVSGRVDQGGGLVWRARDAQNYYIARYNPLEDNFRVYVVQDGRRRQLESATVEVDHTAWHALRVVMRGEQIECYLDGTRHLEASDDTFPEAGQLGLWTKADAVTHFDDLALAAIEAPAG